LKKTTVEALTPGPALRTYVAWGTPVFPTCIMGLRAGGVD
jgi:hypothetical protein